MLITTSMHSRNGFTLIEVLVAVVVLAIGLLGLASLQVFGLRNNHSAYMRSQATLLAYDMADRMRANPVGLNNGKYNKPAATAHPPCLTTTGCSPTEMAEQDMREWTNTLTGQLPRGTGIVCIDSTPDDGTATATAASCDGSGNVYVIKVWWDDDRSGTFQRFVMSFEP